MHLHPAHPSPKRVEVNFNAQEILVRTAVDWGLTPRSLNHRSLSLLQLNEQLDTPDWQAKRHKEVMRPNLAAIQEDIDMNCLA